MRTKTLAFTNPCKNIYQRGVSLIELVAFILVVSIASGALFNTYNYSLLHNVDPIIQMRALELAQSKLDEILALKYDANTATGGIPACNSTGGAACNNSPDGDMNDVDDFNGYSDAPYVGAGSSYSRSVTVTLVGNQKLITVKVNAPMNWSVTLAAYKANF
jgi:MSHA pilin protein MshD